MFVFNSLFRDEIERIGGVFQKSAAAAIIKQFSAKLFDGERRLNACSDIYFLEVHTMTRIIVLTMFVFAACGIAAAQDKADFSGKWTLDKERSDLGRAGAGIESITMTVTQKDGKLSVETQTKRGAPPEGTSARPGGGGRMGAGGGRPAGLGGGFIGGDTSYTYSLDGKETTIQQETPVGTMPLKLKAKQDGLKLSLSQSRTISGPMGDNTITTTEEWNLSADGKTLTVKRENQNPRGAMTTTYVYTK